MLKLFDIFRCHLADIPWRRMAQDDRMLLSLKREEKFEGWIHSQKLHLPTATPITDFVSYRMTSITCLFLYP